MYKYRCVTISTFALFYVTLSKVYQIYKLKDLLKVIANMISAKLYYRKGNSAYINLSGAEVRELKATIPEREEYLVSIEDSGNKITLTKQEKSIKP